MAGHSKWHNIKHRKAAQDAKKAKVYTKIGKLIEIAARSGADPKLNPGLETVLAKAKAANLPKDIIEKAIKKGSGQIEGEQLEEVYYEGYGPGGTALYIKTITSNRNRTNASIKSILAKMNCNMGEPGCVAWQFQEKGVIYITAYLDKKTEKGKQIIDELPLDMDRLEEQIIQTAVQDYEVLDEGVRIITNKEDFAQVLDFFEQANYKIPDADIEYLPDTYIALGDDEANKLERLIDTLDEDDDVDTVFHNAE